VCIDSQSFQHTGPSSPLIVADATINPDRELQELTDVEIQDLIARTGIVVSSDFRSIISEHPNFAIDFANGIDITTDRMADVVGVLRELFAEFYQHFWSRRTWHSFTRVDLVWW
jgi:hypothetical protein